MFLLKASQCFGSYHSKTFHSSHAQHQFGAIVYMLNSKCNYVHYIYYIYRLTTHYFWIDIGWCFGLLLSLSSVKSGLVIGTSISSGFTIIFTFLYESVFCLPLLRIVNACNKVNNNYIRLACKCLVCTPYNILGCTQLNLKRDGI